MQAEPQQPLHSRSSQSALLQSRWRQIMPDHARSHGIADAPLKESIYIDFVLIYIFKSDILSLLDQYFRVEDEWAAHT